MTEVETASSSNTTSMANPSERPSADPSPDRSSSDSTVVVTDDGKEASATAAPVVDAPSAAVALPPSPAPVIAEVAAVQRLGSISGEAREGYRISAPGRPDILVSSSMLIISADQKFAEGRGFLVRRHGADLGPVHYPNTIDELYALMEKVIP